MPNRLTIETAINLARADTDMLTLHIERLQLRLMEYSHPTSLYELNTAFARLQRLHDFIDRVSNELNHSDTPLPIDAS